jgi:hypothetical protein
MVKVRVNVSVDKGNLEKARKKLKFFGGKLSTLFDAFLEDFNKSADLDVGREHEKLVEKVKELEIRLERVEGKK